MKLSTHHQRPGVVQSFARIGSSAQPFSGYRRLLGRVGEQFILAHPAFLISLRGDRARRMINEFKVAFVTRQVVGRTAIQDVLKHLIRFGPNHPHWSIANLDRRAGRRWRAEWKQRRQRGLAPGRDRFH